MEWCPDGELFLTATTAPRLRMGNGFKIWHYSGALLHETNWPEGQELYEVTWQKYADSVYSEKPITNVKVQGIQSSQPQASKAKYVPPNVRDGSVLSSSPRAGEDEKSRIPGLPLNYRVSQGQLKKNRNGRRKNSEKTEGENTTTTNGSNSNNALDRQPTTARRNQTRDFHRPNNQQQPDENNEGGNGNTDNNRGPSKRRPNRNNRNNQGTAIASTGDPEKDKRAKTIHKKLQDITKLKARRDKGEILEANQLSKINLEKELLHELESLKITT